MVFSTALKPAASTLTTYTPGVSAPELYSPVDVTSGVVVCPVAWDVILTLALGTLEPLGSKTAPCIDPVDNPACPKAGELSGPPATASITPSMTIKVSPMLQEILRRESIIPPERLVSNVNSLSVDDCARNRTHQAVTDLF